MPFVFLFAAGLAEELKDREACSAAGHVCCSTTQCREQWSSGLSESIINLIYYMVDGFM